ncbi:TonB-dependent receptor [Cellulophaga sp. Hel_I_12]|uniref:SusC/RagA family TonB-linked outer membrane protein n=1 Tax=Cellulophaga sp. Hel_I_12 TaxID=1249972 RepID=UPI0006465EDA|nr:TonB-dependent receptor [Cellulophaga sp. Hel_I_12]
MKLKLFNQKFKLLFACFLFSSLGLVSAQTMQISGTVTSAGDNMPLPGASVIVKGTTNGTSTDFDGRFTITVANLDAVLVVSYIGYTPQEVNALSSEMTITLQEDASALDEIVVVGYGTQRKSDIQNAVATTDLEKAVLTPTSDVTEMLRGRIAGLQVQVGGGTLRPGGNSEIIFRGRGSIEGNTSAIYVVDGIIRDGGIEDINADDITSIEVLKDASAQAIYGSRGANGVILITTKRGTSGQIQVNYHGFVTSKTVERNFDVYSGQEFAQLRREAIRANNATDEYPNEIDAFSLVEIDNIANNRFVDWEEELLRSGLINSQTISISGGTEMTKVYSSINYFKENGIIPTSSYSRTNLRLNVDQKINDKFSVAFDLNLLTDDIARSANVNVITTSPLGSAFDADGNITQFPSGEELTATNPLWNLREQTNDELGNDFVINISPMYKITDNLSYQLKANLTRKNSERGQYQSSLSSPGATERGVARIENQTRKSYLIENILNYDKEFTKDHKFNLTLVQSSQEDRFNGTLTEGQGFPNEDLGYNGIGNAIGNVTVVRAENPLNLTSYMARLRYNLLDRYLFSGTFRADAASTNAENNKWAQSTAASFAWKMHNESFFREIDAIQELKFRASYGTLVNFPSSPFRSLFTAEDQPYIFNGQTASGFSPTGVLPNRDLKYERVTTLNLGLDFSLFDRFLTGAFEYYDARTTDLLLQRGVPSITGYNRTYFNAGELQNTGVELSLTANLINTQDFRWSVSTNWSNNKNNLVDLYNDGNGDAILEDDAFDYFVGQPVGVIRQYAFDGIWQVGDDFANAPQANPESTIVQTDLRPGDIRIKDTNGVDIDGNITGVPDGRITPEDRVYTDPNPDWFGSLSSTLNYKGFDLFVDFYAVEGATRVNPFLSDFNNGGTLSGKLNGVKVPYYTPENPSTTFPRPSFDTAPQYLNSLAIKDASYVRLRTLSLGYTLPSSSLPKLNIDSIQFYVTATNVFTKTDYIGYSPEVNIRNTFSTADTGYPDARALTFGVKVGL